MEVAYLGAADIIVGVGTAEGELNIHIAQGDVADIALVVLGTVAQLDEDGVAGIGCLETVDYDVLYLRTVDALDGNA